MPKATILQESFSSGEVSPLIYGRVTSDRYKSSMALCENYIPVLQGPLTRRPGTKFCIEVKDKTNPPKLIPFKYSITVDYILEFGDQYIRFYTNNGQVISNSTYYRVTKVVEAPGVTEVEGVTSIANLGYFTRLNTLARPGDGTILTSTTVTGPATLELKTPYKIADVPDIKFAQNGNSLYLVHPKYQPMVLSIKDNAYEWALVGFINLDGPYLPLNSYKIKGDGARITLTPSAIGSGSYSFTTGPYKTIIGVTNGGAGTARVTTSTDHGYKTGDLISIVGVLGATQVNSGNITQTNPPPYWSIVVINVAQFDIYRPDTGAAVTGVSAYSSGGATYPALFTGDWPQSLGTTSDGYRKIAIIDAGKRIPFTIYNNANFYAFNINALIDSGYSYSNTSALTFWYMGVFKSGAALATNTSLITGYNWPGCISFHQDRLFFSGMPFNVQEVDASVPGDYANFQPSDPTTLDVSDSDALQFNLNSKELNAILWMSPTAQGLLAGSGNSEWAMTPSGNSDVLTPTNFNALETSFFGSANVAPAAIGNAVMYIQRAFRKVRELNFFFQVGTFRSSDMSELSEHLTIPTVTKLVVQKETQPLVWALRSDGRLLSMTYNRDDVSLKAGWAQHFLGGQSDSAGSAPVVLDIAVIPSPDTTFDQLWCVVRRYINGTSIVGIEYMEKIWNEAVAQEDSYHLDCGVTYNSPKTITAISIASTAVVTSAAHGFSNGDTVKINDVIGLEISETDQDGNETLTNLVNGITFKVAGVTTNTFQLNGFSGNPISSSLYSVYVSGGTVRKLVTTISGLTWLKNETISVLTDGGIHSDVVVDSSGAITLEYPAAKVQLGYSYQSNGKLLRLDAGGANGTSVGQTRRMARFAAMLYKIGDFLIGMTFDRLVPMNFPIADNQQADNATPLYSGIMREHIEAEYDFDNQICFRQASPLPGVIQSITTFIEEQDV